MLDLYQINELESSWERLELKRRNKFKIPTIICTGVLLVCGIILALQYSFSIGKSELIAANESSNAAAKKLLEKAHIAELKDRIIAKKQPTNFKPEINTQNDAPSKELNTQTIVKTNPSKPTAEGENKSNATVLPELNFKIPHNTFKQEVVKKTAPKQSKIATPPPREVKVKAGKSEKLNNDISYLKERFEKTKSQYFALDIAKAYLQQKDYANAQHWSLVANEIDGQNEDSWIIFARAKAASGDAKDAKRVLKSYLTKNPNSAAASALLDEITN